jgi:hypothetical protein
MSKQQAIHFRDQKAPPRRPNTTGGIAAPNRNHPDLTRNHPDLTTRNHPDLTTRNQPGLTRNHSNLTTRNHSDLTTRNQPDLTTRNQPDLPTRNHSNLTTRNHPKLLQQSSSKDLSKNAASQRYQNSRAVNKQHKSVIFNACSSISLRHGSGSQRQLDIGSNQSVQSRHTTTSFNTSRSLLQHDVDDEGTVLTNRSSGTQIKKYFGKDSREELYSRYHSLSRKQCIMNQGECRGDYVCVSVCVCVC